MSTESSENRNKRSADDRREPQSDAIVQKSHEVTSNIKQAALERVNSVKQSAHALRDDASDHVRKLGDAMHKVGEHFRIEDQQYVAEQMTSVSKRVNRLADYVSSAELGTLMRDTRNLARRKPALFLSGAFLLGLGAGRFFKGTSLIAGLGSTPRVPREEPKLPSEVENAATNGGQAQRQAAKGTNESMSESSRGYRGY